ncbi:hypothetical protein ACFL2T_07725 [Elusimicrobiota bacterium]
MRLFLSFCLVVAASLPATAAGAKPATDKSGRAYVNASVRGSLSNYYDIREYNTDIWLNVHMWGNSVDFNGRPFSGDIWGGGNWFSVTGSGLSGSINRWGNAYDVRVTVTDMDGKRHDLDFTMYANGRTDDPKRPPHFSVFNGDASLDVRPVFGLREYSVNGWVDKEKFGSAGTVFACLVATMVMHELSEKQNEKSLPKAAWLKESPVFRAGFD